MIHGSGSMKHSAASGSEGVTPLTEATPRINTARYRPDVNEARINDLMNKSLPFRSWMNQADSGRGRGRGRNKAQPPESAKR